MAQQKEFESIDMPMILKYDGESIANGDMDVYDLATGLIAFSDFLVMTAHSAFGQDVLVTAKIKPFRKGSFISDMVFHLAGVTGTLVSCQFDIKSVLSLAKELLGFIKFLGGEKPKAINKIEGSPGAVIVENSNGVTINISMPTLILAEDPKCRDAIESFMSKPLQKDGVDSVDVLSDDVKLVSADKEESRYFVSDNLGEVVHEESIRQRLIIAYANLSDNPKNKWKFIVDNRPESFSMADADFMRRVEGHLQSFRKDDIFDCDVTIAYKRSGSSLKVKDRIITKVHYVQNVEHQVDLIGK